MRRGRIPGSLRSWLKQERHALANPGWRALLLIAAPLLLALVGLEASRRLRERGQQLEERQQQAIDLLQWLAGQHRRIALDWAHWDDTLAFVEGRNPGFPANDMGTTSLLKEGAVMAIWGPDGQPLAIRGGSPRDGSPGAPLQRCLQEVETKHRSSGVPNLNVLCPGMDQLYVGSIEAISDNTSSRRTDASLAYVVPLPSLENKKPLAESLRRLQSELVLGEAGDRQSRARVLGPPLWTSGGRMARVLPPATAATTLPALQPLAILIAASGALVVGLRLQWMLAMRRQQLQARRSEQRHGRRIREVQRGMGQLLEKMQGRGRSGAAGAFARLLDQQTSGEALPAGQGENSGMDPRPEERHVQRLEQILASAGTLVLNDSLTGLPNRSYFLQQLTWNSEHCQAEGISLALLFINIDKFKRINETYGHNVGDTVLRHVAVELQRLIQPDDFLARFGGDEFGLILATAHLPNRSEPAIRELAHQRALALLDQFNSRINLDPEHLNVSLSIGIALSDLRGTSAEELIRRSDRAMVIAKQRHNSAVSIFDINSNAPLPNDYRVFNALESDLNEAPDRFQVVFQPIVGLDGRILEVEALARWVNPQHPAITPELFIGLAERYRLIDKLGRLLLDRSLTGFQLLQQELNQGSSLRLAINISPSQLQQHGFAYWLLDQLRLRQIPAAAITVEVTESAVIETTDDLNANLASLRQAGVRLALDDFGTGFSSLRLLMGLRPDELKIDKSFVAATVHDALAQQIVMLLQQLTETMGLTLVAEGVEDETIRDRLMEAGVRCFQGYLYSRPASPAALIAQQGAGLHAVTTGVHNVGSGTHYRP
jgi:diguanylate cyclase (GGDEF)-like protein